LHVTPAIAHPPGVDIVSGPDERVDKVEEVVKDVPGNKAGGREVFIARVPDHWGNTEQKGDQPQDRESHSLRREVEVRFLFCSHREGGLAVQTSRDSREAKMQRSKAQPCIVRRRDKKTEEEEEADDEERKLRRKERRGSFSMDGYIRAVGMGSLLQAVNQSMSLNWRIDRSIKCKQRQIGRRVNQYAGYRQKV
jgi:hypothetical protein